MERLKAIIIENPFNPIKTRTTRIIDYIPGQDIALYRTQLCKSAAVVTSVNGRVIKENESYIPRDGDCIVFTPVIAGGDSNSTMRIVAMIIVMVVSLVLPAAIGLVGMQAAVLTATIAVVGGLLVNALLPYPEVTSEDDESYQWGGTPNTQDQGGAIPRIYGQVRHGGNIIQARLTPSGDKQYMAVLICYGKGPISAVTDVQLNGQDLSFSTTENEARGYSGVELAVRKGYIGQTVIDAFNDTTMDVVLARKLVYGSPETYTLPDNDYNRIQIFMQFPSGLYKLSSEGHINSNTCSYRIQYRKVDAGGAPLTAYTTITYSITEQTAIRTTASTGQWLRGYWKTNLGRAGGYFYCVEEGSSVATDHYNGEDGGIESGQSTTWYWFTGDNYYYHTDLVSVDYHIASEDQTSPVTYFHEINVSDSKGFYELQFTRLTAEGNTTDDIKDLYIYIVREVYNDDFEYPSLALLGCKALATSDFSGSFNMTALVKGRLVKTYDGATWTVQWTDNPAWICYDVLTSPVFTDALAVSRYDGFAASALDTDSFKDWADFCDETVSNGSGSTMKRWQWNGAVDTTRSRWAWALTIAQEAQAALVWRGTKIYVVIDKPVSDLSQNQMFNMANIIEGSFKGGYVGLDDRAGQIEVTYRNQDNDYENEKMIIYDTDLSNLSMTNKAQITLTGITHPSQAWRYGMLRLRYNNYLLEWNEFEVDIDAIACTVGDVVNVGHDVPQWGYSGRVVTADSTSLTMDAAVSLPAGNKSVTVRLSDDSYVTRAITNASTVATNLLSLETSFTTPPVKYDPYSVGLTGTLVKPFRVTAIKPGSDQHRRVLTLIEYIAGIYDLAAPVNDVNYSLLSADLISSVGAFGVKERLLKKDNRIITCLDLGFNIPTSSFWKEAELWYQTATAPTWKYLTASVSGQYTMEDVIDLESYTFKAVSVNQVGQKESFKDAPQCSITPKGQTAPPEDVSNFWASSALQGLYLSWTAVSDIDIDYYKIRYNSDTTAGTWYNSLDIATVYGTAVTLPAAKDGAYFIKAVDLKGNESQNAVAVITNLAAILNHNAHATLTEDPAFAGTKTYTAVIDGKLILDTTGDFDAIGDVDAIDNWDTLGLGISTGGYYESSTYITLGSIQTARVEGNVSFLGIDTENLFDNVTDFDAITDMDGAVDGVGVQLQISYTTNLSTWSSYSPFVVGDYTAQAFRFRLYLYSDRQSQYPSVSALSFDVDMPDREERGEDLVVSTAGSTISFGKPFMARPIVGITIQSASAGDFYQLTNLDTSGFTVFTKDSGGSAVARTIDWIADGY